MQRIIVIGCPGGGKSTFSRALGEKCGLTVYHLDMLFWNPDKTIVDRAVFHERQAEVISRDEWIIDGNFGSTLEMRLVACDTVFFLDYPTELCLAGIRARRGMPRPDLPWIETEEDEEFIEYVQSFGEKQAPEIMEIIEKHKAEKRIIVFRTREEADEFLMELNA